MTIAASDPLFSNDLAGFVKIMVVMLMGVLLPIAALVVYFLKRGPDAELAKMKFDMDGIGSRINVAEQNIVRVEQIVITIQQNIVDSQRDVMQAIQLSGQAQVNAVHNVELQVARLQERNDLGECLSEFGRSIERLVKEVQRVGKANVNSTGGRDA